VSAAAKAAAEAYAQRAEVAAAAGGASASTAAMRSMIDAAARSRSGSRPGSAAAIRGGGGGLGQAEAAAVGMSQPADAAAAALEEEEEEQVQVRPVDTKSLRRLMDDMRSRGWQVRAATAHQSIPVGDGGDASRGSDTAPAHRPRHGHCSPSPGCWYKPGRRAHKPPHSCCWLPPLLSPSSSSPLQFMPEVSSGHLRCQRTFPDLPGKQVYFLCCTPSGG
jgi:hypothetical protein